MNNQFFQFWNMFVVWVYFTLKGTGNFYPGCADIFIYIQLENGVLIKNSIFPRIFLFISRDNNL